MISSALWTLTMTGWLFNWMWWMPSIWCKKSHLSKTLWNMWHIIQFNPFVHAFHAFESLLSYNHHNRENKVTIIPFARGTYQGDPLRGALFVLAHFRTLHSIANCFPSCLFPSIASDTHIIGPSPFNCIIYIWTLPNWTLQDRFFYPTSKMCNMVPF
jgi:hypothetical protein